MSLKSNVVIGTQITLEETEVRLCRYIAKARNQGNRQEGVRNAKVGDLSDAAMDLEGIGAELAFCKLFNLFPDLSITTRSSMKGTDEDADCTLPDGLTVDVKTTTRENGRLLAPRWKKTGVDLYVLMVGSFPTYSFRGFISGKELLQERNLMDLGHGQTYAVDQTQLKSLGQMVA